MMGEVDMPNEEDADAHNTKVCAFQACDCRRTAADADCGRDR